MKKIIDFLIKYGIYIALVLIILYLFNTTSTLKDKVQDAVSKAKEHEIKAKFYLDIYHMQLEKDSALEAKYNQLLIQKSKIKYNEKIINKYTVGDMQYYFNERAKQGSNPR